MNQSFQSSYLISLKAQYHYSLVSIFSPKTPRSGGTQNLFGLNSFSELNDLNDLINASKLVCQLYKTVGRIIHTKGIVTGHSYDAYARFDHSQGSFL